MRKKLKCTGHSFRFSRDASVKQNQKTLKSGWRWTYSRLQSAWKCADSGAIMAEKHCWWRSLVMGAKLSRFIFRKWTALIKREWLISYLLSVTRLVMSANLITLSSWASLTPFLKRLPRLPEKSRKLLSNWGMEKMHALWFLSFWTSIRVQRVQIKITNQDKPCPTSPTPTSAQRNSKNSLCWESSTFCHAIRWIFHSDEWLTGWT